MAQNVGRGGSTEAVMITPEMIEAGVLELREKAFGEPLEEIVAAVFLAMKIEQLAV